MNRLTLLEALLGLRRQFWELSASTKCTLPISRHEAVLSPWFLPFCCCLAALAVAKQVLHLSTIITPNFDAAFALALLWCTPQILCSSYFVRYAQVSVHESPLGCAVFSPQAVRVLIVLTLYRWAKANRHCHPRVSQSGQQLVQQPASHMG